MSIQELIMYKKLFNIQGGTGGTSDHRQLTGRDAANQHPISAITGLEQALSERVTETWVNNKTDFESLNSSIAEDGLGYMERGAGEIAWDGDVTGRILFQDPYDEGAVLCKVSERAFTARQLVGAVLSASSGGSMPIPERFIGTIISDNGGEAAYIIVSDTPGVYSAKNAGTYTLPNGNSVIIPAPGTYFIMFSESLEYISSLVYDYELVHKIDEKFIPNPPFIVNVSYQTSTEEYVADHTFNEILEAVQAKRDVFVRSNNGYTDFDYTLYSAHETEIKFVNTHSNNDGTWSYTFTVDDDDTWSYENTGFSFSPVEVTDEMTQPVGYDRETGEFYTKPGKPNPPVITISLSQVVSQSPLSILLTAEQHAIMINDNYTEVVFDVSSLGVGVASMSKVSTDGVYGGLAITPYWSFSTMVPKGLNSYSYVYDPSTKIVKVVESELFSFSNPPATETWVSNAIAAAIGDAIGGSY